MKIYTGYSVIDVVLDTSSYRYRGIMGENTLNLFFSSEEFIEIPVGSYCEFEGVTYTLKKPENFKKHGSRNYSYTLILNDCSDNLNSYKVRDIVSKRVKFHYTAKPIEHLELLVTNLNMRESGWKVGECIDADEKVIAYNHSFISDALKSLAETFGTEWEIDSVTQTIHLRKVEYNKDAPLALSYGKGNGLKPGVGRSNLENGCPVNLLYVQGGSKNIDPSKYGASELLLPKSQKLEYEGRTYITDDEGLYITRVGAGTAIVQEDSLDCSHIYPKRIGSVGEVVVVDVEKNFYDFTDPSIPDELDFNQCLMEGETMTVIFNTGMLAGDNKEFEVTYNHEERKFEITPQEIDGVIMPNETYKPVSGDDYGVFGIQLPDSYVCNNESKSGASWEMFSEGVRYLYDHEERKISFTGELDGIWAKKRWLSIGGKIKLGGYILFSDPDFEISGSLIRIVGIKDYIHNPYSPYIELSNSAISSNINTTLNKIDENEVLTEKLYLDAIRFTKRRFRDARETADMLSKALLHFTDAISPITVQTMSLLVGDESLQFRFVNSKTNPVQVSHNITYNAETKQLNVPSGIIQHLTLGINTISSEHSVSEYKFWDMAAYVSPVLSEASDAYYLYAKVSKSNQTGTFLLSKSAVAMEAVSGYYHLLVGILNSEYEEERSFVEMYGFTEVLPGRVTTEKIVSPDGETYFDLSKGEIGGNIKIKAGSSGLKNLAEFEELNGQISALENSLDDTNDAIDDLGDYVDGAFADGIISEAEAKAIEKYINTVKNSKAAVEATYTKLYGNAYLSGEPKTNLLNAKITLFGAIDNLLTSINNAIADGVTTVAEKNDVDNKFASFNSAMADFNTAVEAANKAIQDVLKSYSDEALAELEIANGQISAQAKKIDSINGTIESAGWITKADGNTWWASKTMENGDTLISYINQAAGSTTIASSKINLVGAVTFNSFSTALQGIINGKANSSDLGDLASKDSVSKAMLDSVLSALIDGKADDSDLGSLAYKSAVESAMLGSTIIVGGYLNTDYIKVKKIEAIEGTIAGFHISGTGLINTGFNNDAYVIFRNDTYNTFAGIGGNILPASTGLRAVARFENHDTTDQWGFAANYTMLVSAQGGRDNVAIGINGGSIYGMAMKNTIVGTSVTSKTLERSDYNVLTINTSECTITLPTMQLYDDGHVIRIKRLGSGNLKIKLGYCYTWNGTSYRYTRPIMIYNQNSKLIGTNTLELGGVCDSMELVWCRDLQYTIDNTVYYGAWIQYKLPRDW